MIEFTGYITGKSEKHYWKKARDFGRNIFWIAMLLLSPAIIAIAINFHYWEILIGYSGMFVAIPLLCYIPQGKKEKMALTPQKIVTDGEYIIAIGDKFEECKKIKDARQMIDHGTFYDITFPIYNYSDKFVCQKSLLSKGTLEDFEQLFQGKIKRVEPR